MKIFISYSHQDEAWKDRVVLHLKVLRDHGILEIWDDREIRTGKKWRPEIEDALNSSDVAVLLVSPAFLTSEFIRKEEVPRILQSGKLFSTSSDSIRIRLFLWRENRGSG